MLRAMLKVPEISLILSFDSISNEGKYLHPVEVQCIMILNEYINYYFEHV